jgi:DNA recombination protein RmuC
MNLGSFDVTSSILIVSLLLVPLLLVLAGLVHSRQRATRLAQELNQVMSAHEAEQRIQAERFTFLSEQHQGMCSEADELRAQVTDFGLRNAHLEALLQERNRSIQQQSEQFEQQKASFQQEFENLANRIFEEKGKTFTQSSQASMDSLLRPFREQIKEFRERVDGIHKENNQSAGSLQKELELLRGMNLKMSQDAQNLTTALKGDKKTLGNWGEVQLERSLELAGLVKGQHYDTQVHARDEKGKSNYPDFVIKLPEDKHLIIDSKASLVSYEKAVSSVSDDSRLQAMNAYVQVLRNHIKDLSEKNYSRLKGLNSPSFVLMFVPIEAAYIEALRFCPELYEEAYRKNIILVSHMTLLPILKTISNIWRLQNSQDNALALSQKAGDIYNQVCSVAERVQRLGGTLLSANKHYNGVLVSLVGQQGLHGKVERFRDSSIEANRQMPEIDSLHSDLELDRLDAILTQNEHQT